MRCVGPGRPDRCIRAARVSCVPSPEVHTARCAEKPEQTNNDQVNRDDIVEKPRHNQDENAGDQCHQGTYAERHVHGRILLTNEHCIGMSPRIAACLRLGGLGSAVSAGFTMHYCAFLRAARWISADRYAAKTRAWRLQVVAAGPCCRVPMKRFFEVPAAHAHLVRTRIRDLTMYRVLA